MTESKWLTTSEAALLLGVSARYISRLVGLGALPCKRIGNPPGRCLRYFARADLLAYQGNHPALGQRRLRTAI